MKKSELNKIAKDILTHTLARAGYAVDEDYFDLPLEEKEIILNKIDKYGKAMCKAIGKKYYTV